MGAVRTSETSVYSNETTRIYIPEDSHIFSYYFLAQYRISCFTIQREPLVVSPTLLATKLLFVHRLWSNFVNTYLSPCETASCHKRYWNWSTPESTYHWTRCSKSNSERKLTSTLCKPDDEVLTAGYFQQHEADVTRQIQAWGRGNERFIGDEVIVKDLWSPTVPYSTPLDSSCAACWMEMFTLTTVVPWTTSKHSPRDWIHSCGHVNVEHRLQVCMNAESISFSALCYGMQLLKLSTPLV
jgi:hypothetical protein